jgi:hypothetical protein
MAITSSTTVANWLLTEVMSELALAPLRGKYVLLPFLNMSNISGRSSKSRKIRKATAISAAVDGTEGTAFSNPSTLGVAANITITPTVKEAGVQPTIDAIELALPGASRSDVINAINSNNASMLPFIRDVMTEILEAHYLRAETDALALFSGLSESASSSGNNPTAAPLDFATLLSALVKLLDNNPSSEDLVYVLDEVGVGDLRTLAAGGSGAALSSIFSGNSMGGDVSFFNHRPDVTRSGYRGSFAGIPIFAANKAVMAQANSGNADRVGALIVAGRGETGTSGSIRGFAEFCERYEPSLGFQYDLADDTLLAVGRWAWAVGEHTDEHGVKIIYDKT